MRVLAINDISCVGKCSLTVALPIISASGVTCDILPTAILSTHTGGFRGYTFRDLSEDIPAMIAHWKSLGLQYDIIISGYLGSVEQIEMVKTAERSLLKEGGTDGRRPRHGRQRNPLCALRRAFCGGDEGAVPRSGRHRPQPDGSLLFDRHRFCRRKGERLRADPAKTRRPLPPPLHHGVRRLPHGKRETHHPHRRLLYRRRRESPQL